VGAPDQVLGAHLRRVRRMKRLSLAQVARLSHDEFKSSALSAYERGERVLSAGRLVRLARIYGMRPAELLPTSVHVPDAPAGPDAPAHEPSAEVRAMSVWHGDDQALARFADAVSAIRRPGRSPDPGFRASDVFVLAAALGANPSDVAAALSRLIRDPGTLFEFAHSAS